MTRHINTKTLRHLEPGAPGSATGTIGPEGGVLEIPRDLTIFIEAGTLDASSSFYVGAQSHARGFVVSMSPPQTLKKPAVVAFQGIDHAAEDLALGYEPENKITELYAMTREGASVVARIPHFSGWMVSVGLQAGEPCDPDVVTDGTCVFVG